MTEFTTIPLTQGKETIVDVADLPLIEGYKWYARRSATTYYVASTPGSRSKKRQVLMHRLIIGTPTGVGVDHVNGNGLDNRRSNLRLATPSQNAMNRRVPITNTSGFKGVSYLKNQRKWIAILQINGGTIRCGCFDDPSDAARAYDQAALEHAGEFAWLNFPNEVPQ